MVLALALAGCAGPGTPPPEGVPPHPGGAVVGSGLVLQIGDSPPELCFSVFTSRPPQCFGIALIGWNWADVEASETELGATWGQYAVMGHFDGESITVTDVLPADDYSPQPAEDPLRLPENAGATPENELLAYQRQLHAEAPFHVEGSAPTNGYLFVTVRWDDGTYQNWLDRRFGPGVAKVESTLRVVDAG